MVDIDVEFVAKLATKDDLRKATRRPQPPLRIRRVASVTSTTGAAVPNIMSLGNPSAGRVWNVMSLAVVGNDDHTAVAGSTVALYAGDPTSPSLGQLIMPATAGTVLPFFEDIGTNVIWIESMAELFVIVNGAGVGQNLTAVTFCLDYRQSDRDPIGV